MNIFGEDTIFQYSKELLLVIVILCVIKFYVDRWRIFSLGNKIPGPKCWPVLGNALEFVEDDLDLMRKLNYLNEKYGFVRFWLGSYLHVMICSPEDAEIFCRSNDLLDRSDHFKHFKPVLGNGILTSSGPQWEKAKRLMEPSFTFTNIRSYFPIMKKNSDKLIRILRERSKNEQYPFRQCLVNCTYDIISEATMNNTIGAQDGNAEVLKCVEEVMAQLWNRAYSPWQWSDFIYGLLEVGKKFQKNSELIKNFIDYQINSFKKIYFQEKEKLKDQGYERTLRHKVFLYKLLEDEAWSDSELRDHFVTMLATGFETTSTAVCFAAMLLGIHKDVQEKLYLELSSSLNKDFEVEDVLELEYLDRVIKESLRIFPISPMSFRQATKDIQFTEYLIPKGSAVGINTFLIHRDPKQWDNPNDFDPDHFLPEKVAKRHNYSYNPFLRGRRKCIAGKFAFTSVKFLTAKILLNFKIDSDIDMQGIEKGIRDHITLKMKNGYYPVRLTPR